MAQEAENDDDNGGVLPRKSVLYCGACGMPPEYCEYGPDFETHCDPWLRKHHPEFRKELQEKRGGVTAATGEGGNDKDDKPSKPDRPWTTEERLTAFYEKYVPEKIEAIPGLLEKYAGKEDKLFQALTKKYGPEPLDPYYSDSDDDDDDEETNEDAGGGGGVGEPGSGKGSKNKRRGASAKKTGSNDKFTGKVLVQKQAQKKRRVLTVVTGLEPALAIHNHKLKDATKAFAKKFAGSSSVKSDGSIILQGDHVLELAEMLVDKFQVPEEAVYVDMGDDMPVPLR